MQFRSAFVIIAFFTVVSHASSVADCLVDLAKINTSVNSLNAAINSFPTTGGSLTAALAIHTDAASLDSSIVQGAAGLTSVVPKPVSEADSATILAAVKGFEPTILDALNGIVGKKPALTALPVGGVPVIIKQDLSNLNASTSKFQAALTACVRPDFQGQAAAIKSAVDAAFTKAIAAYA